MAGKRNNMNTNEAQSSKKARTEELLEKVKDKLKMDEAKEYVQSMEEKWKSLESNYVFKETSETSRILAEENLKKTKAEKKRDVASRKVEKFRHDFENARRVEIAAIEVVNQSEAEVNAAKENYDGSKNAAEKKLDEERKEFNTRLAKAKSFITRSEQDFNKNCQIFEDLGNFFPE